MNSILIKHGYIITMKGEGTHVIEDGALAIEQDRIVSVGTTKEVTQEYSGEFVIDASGQAILPGLIDCHIHSTLSLLRGLGQDVAETEWMFGTIAPFRKHFTKEDEIIGSKLCVLEAMKTGTTCFGDYGTYMPDLAQEVYEPFGVRANLCSTINELSPGRRDITKLFQFEPSVGETKLKEGLNLIDKWHGSADGRITCLFGPHAPDMLSKELLLYIKELAQERRLSMHMHVAQSWGREHKQVFERYGKSPVRFLEEIGYLSPQLIAAHCHATTPEELKLLAQSGTRMIGCPGSICLIDGIVPPLWDYISAGGTAALGSDQSPPDGNRMLDQMRYAAISNKIKHQDATVLPAWKILRMATIEAAKCLRLDHQIGSLESGKKADVILLDLNQPHFIPNVRVPVRNLIPNIVYQANGSEVTNVIVDGKIIIENRLVKTIDEAKILQKAQRAAEELAEKATDDFIKADSGLVSMMRDGKL